MNPPDKKVDMNVMDSIKKSRGEGPKKEMNSVEIIQEAIQPYLSSGINPQTFLSKVAGWLQTPTNKLLQVNNTVYFLTKMSDEVCNVGFLSVDNEKDLIQSLGGMTKALKNEGFKKLTGYANDPKYVDVVKKADIGAKIDQGSKMVGEQAQPVYTFEVDL